MAPDGRQATIADYRQLGRDQARQIFVETGDLHRRGERLDVGATILGERARLVAVGASEAELAAWSAALTGDLCELLDRYRADLDVATAVMRRSLALALAAAPPRGRA